MKKVFFWSGMLAVVSAMLLASCDSGGGSSGQRGQDNIEEGELPPTPEPTPESPLVPEPEPAPEPIPEPIPEAPPFEMEGPDLVPASGVRTILGAVGDTLLLDVPVGATVKQVLLYWDSSAGVFDDSILVNGRGGTGVLINDTSGGVRPHYRADITALGVVTAGSNSLSLDGVDGVPAGAAVHALFDDGSGTVDLQLIDAGHEQTFQFAPGDIERIAELILFNRQAQVQTGQIIVLDGETELRRESIEIPQLAGDLWGQLIVNLSLPAGADTVTVTFDDTSTGAWPMTRFLLRCRGAIEGVVAVVSGIDDEGIEVVLRNAADEVLVRKSTLAGGSYTFAGLCAGSYSVAVSGDRPPGGIPPGGCNTAGVDCPSASVVLPGDDSVETAPELDVLASCTSSIVGKAWLDGNRDGNISSGEPGIQGATVVLRSEFGLVLGRTLTTSNGDYDFSGLCSGSYVVDIDAETLPPFLTPTPCVDAPTGELNNVCQPTGVRITADIGHVVARSFGYDSEFSAGVRGFIWRDLDRDGFVDLGEPGVGGVKMVILDADGNRVVALSSRPSGSWDYSELAPGLYTVDSDEPLSQTRCDVDGGVVDNTCLPATLDVRDGGVERVQVGLE